MFFVLFLMRFAIINALTIQLTHNVSLRMKDSVWTATVVFLSSQVLLFANTRIDQSSTIPFGPSLSAMETIGNF